MTCACSLVRQRRSAAPRCDSRSARDACAQADCRIRSDRSDKSTPSHHCCCYSDARTDAPLAPPVTQSVAQCRRNKHKQNLRLFATHARTATCALCVDVSSVVGDLCNSRYNSSIVSSHDYWHSRCLRQLPASRHSRRLLCVTSSRQLHLWFFQYQWLMMMLLQLLVDAYCSRYCL